MIRAWRTEAEANKVQSLLETVKRDYKITFDEQTRMVCGFP
jgi:hypothetical protein